MSSWHGLHTVGLRRTYHSPRDVEQDERTFYGDGFGLSFTSGAEPRSPATSDGYQALPLSLWNPSIARRTPISFSVIPWEGRYDRHASAVAVSTRSNNSISFSKSGCPGINAKIASRRSSGSLSSASKIDAGSQSLHRDIQEPLFDATRHFWRFGCCSQASS